MLKKCEMQKLPTFFSKNISVYARFDDQNFNDTLTNDIVSFEQLGPEFYTVHFIEPFACFHHSVNAYFLFHCDVSLIR